MKSNEIIKEGPLWQGIKGMMPGGAGFKAGYAQGQGQQEIDNLVKKASAEWYKTQAAVQQKSQGQPAPAQQKAMIDAVTKHARYWFGTPKLPDYTTATKERTVTPKGIQNYFQIGASTYLTQHLEDPAQQDDNQQQGGGQQQGGQQQGGGQQAGAQQPSAQQQDAALQNIKAQLPNMPDEEIKDNMANLQAKGKAAGDPMFDMYKAELDKRAGGAGQQPQAAGTEQPAAGQQPAADPAHALFKDPNAFKAEWDKFIASKPNYKLIADPELLSTLKSMWMRSGGLKAESKKNKGKRV